MKPYWIIIAKFEGEPQSLSALREHIIDRDLDRREGNSFECPEWALKIETQSEAFDVAAGLNNDFPSWHHTPHYVGVGSLEAAGRLEVAR